VSYLTPAQPGTSGDVDERWMRCMAIGPADAPQQCGRVRDRFDAQGVSTEHSRGPVNLAYADEYLTSHVADCHLS